MTGIPDLGIRVDIMGRVLDPLLCQGQLLEGVECHIYLYCFTFDDINLNRALVIFVLFPTKYSNKKVCANDIRK